MLNAFLNKTKRITKPGIQRKSIANGGRIETATSQKKFNSFILFARAFRIRVKAPDDLL
jgi:hypothetical protein